MATTSAGAHAGHGGSPWPGGGDEKVDRVVVGTVPARRQERRGRSTRWGSLGWGVVWRAGVAIAAGFILYAASPPRPLWWWAPLAFAMFVAVLPGQRARANFCYGTLFGLAYLLPLFGWLQDFLGAQFGPWPWLGVATVEALFFGLAGAGMGRVSRLPAAPVWMATVFVGTEFLRSTVPFGGFPWGRLAFTQPEGFLVPLASLGGASLVTFAIAVIGAGLAETVRKSRHGFRAARAPAWAVILPTALGLAVTPTIGVEPNAGTANVAVVQGNAPNVGLELLHQDDVLHDNHVRAATKLTEDVHTGQAPRPDVVVLPEQIGSWGPERSDPALSRVTSRLGVPVVVGGLAKDADHHLSNRVLRWDPVAGPTAEYTKRHLVPFAESIPMRSIARLVTPFVDRFAQDMVPGNKPGVFTVGPAKLGVGLCYDVAYDDVFADAASAGATLLAVPTNNAWYGHSEMSHQQLAMSRLRAVEHGRAVVVSATSGVSAIVRPDGTVAQRTEQFTAENLSARVPLRANTTLATHLGSLPTWIFTAVGAAAVVFTWRGATWRWQPWRQSSRGGEPK